MLQAVAVGFRRADAILEDQHPNCGESLARFWGQVLAFQAPKPPHFRPHMGQFLSLKELPQDSPAQHHMPLPHAESIQGGNVPICAKPTQTPQGRQNPSVSTTLSSRTELLSSSRSQFPTAAALQHVCWDQRNLSEGSPLCPSHFPCQTHDNPSVLCKHHNFSQKKIFGSPQGAP